MDDKEIFDIINSLDEDESLEIMEQLYIETNNDYDYISDDIKNRIKLKLDDKIKNELNDNTAQVDIINRKSNYILEKNINGAKKKMLKIVGSIIAASLFFVVIVNFCPSIAYALEKIPGIESLVRLIKADNWYYDRGFNNLVHSGQYQEINKTVNKKGIEFTVNSIIGDGAKLWISYDCSEEESIFGDIKFYDNNNDELYWQYYIASNKKYIEVTTDGKLQSFILKVPIYKINDESIRKLETIKKESIDTIKEEKERYKITTINIPVELDNNIFKNNSINEYKIERQINTEATEIIIEKLETSISRTKLHLKINNTNIARISFENLRIVDDNTKKIYYPINDEESFSLDENNNSIVVELDGGITEIDSLRLISDKISYINNEDKYIKLDLNKNNIEENNLGISLNNISDNVIVLNIPNRKIELYLVNKRSSLEERRYYDDGNKVIFEIEGLIADNNEVIFEVLDDEKYKIDGFNIKFIEQN